MQTYSQMTACYINSLVLVANVKYCLVLSRDVTKFEFEFDNV